MYIAILQEATNDKSHILTCALAAVRVYPENPIIIACDEDVKKYIDNFSKHSNTLKHIEWFTPSHMTLTPRNYMRNFLELIANSILNGNEILLLHSRIVLLTQVPISQEIRDQGFAFIRKNIDGHAERPDIRYSCDVVYANTTEALNSIENYFRHNGLFEDPEHEDFNKLIDIWRNMPLRIGNSQKKSNENHDEKVDELVLKSYIDGSGYMTSENFFAFDNKWEVKKLVCCENKLLYDGNTIWGMCIDINVPPQVQSLFKHLISNVVVSHKWAIPLIEMRLSSHASLVIASPPKAGMLHWDRTNSTFYSMVSAICNNSPYLTSKEVNLDYFVLSNYILLDKPGVKWLTNHIKYACGFIYFDYDNDLLTTLPLLKKPFVFGGYVVPYPEILEKTEYIKNRESETYFQATDKTFSSNEEEYTQHLETLAKCTHAYIDEHTPKHRIAECSKLGVIPCIDSAVTIVELPDLLATAETDAEKVDTCMRYYDNHLSIQSITRKLLSTMFNY